MACGEPPSRCLDLAWEGDDPCDAPLATLSAAARRCLGWKCRTPSQRTFTPCLAWICGAAPSTTGRPTQSAPVWAGWGTSLFALQHLGCGLRRLPDACCAPGRACASHSREPVHPCSPSPWCRVEKGAGPIQESFAAFSAAKEASFHELTDAGIQAFAGIRELVLAAQAAGLGVAIASSGSPDKISRNLTGSGLIGLVPAALVGWRDRSVGLLGGEGDRRLLLHVRAWLQNQMEARSLAPTPPRSPRHAV